MSIEPIRYEDGRVIILDQTLLPTKEVWVECKTASDMALAITSMQVRGAPLLGVCAAFGMALGSRECKGSDDFLTCMERIRKMLASTRPTAVNLFWGLRRLMRKAVDVAAYPPDQRVDAMFEEADAIRREDIAMCKSIGIHGACLIRDGETIMTHCNAGALATAGYGSALGVIRAASEQGHKVKVLVRETRPLYQGARLTAWELSRDGIDVTVIPDAAAAHIMRTSRVDRVIVGADRIAANGDTVNKIGTLDLAIIAAEHGIPFHVAAPYSTVDFSIPDGTHVPIEQRLPEEVSRPGGWQIVPSSVPVMNPAFDVTPAKYITSIITEMGIANPPLVESLRALLGAKAG